MKHKPHGSDPDPDLNPVFESIAPTDPHVGLMLVVLTYAPYRHDIALAAVLVPSDTF